MTPEFAYPTLLCSNIAAFVINVLCKEMQLFIAPSLCSNIRMYSHDNNNNLPQKPEFLLWSQGHIISTHNIYVMTRCYQGIHFDVTAPRLMNRKTLPIDYTLISANLTWSCLVNSANLSASQIISNIHSMYLFVQPCHLQITCF